MPKPAKLPLEILKPMVARGLAPKQISHELGFPLRMVHRRLKAFGLRKSKVADLSARAPELTNFQKSGDPILSPRFELDTGQCTAASAIRMACSENIGVDMIRLITRPNSPFHGMTESECATAARMRMKQWLKECRSHIDPTTKQPVDYRPAILIAGHGIAVKSAGRELGISERRASKVCKHTLDIYANMMGWACNDRRRRHAFVTEKATELDSYAKSQQQK